ncbi:TRAP transporter large permease [Enterovirga rhinocerotis]|uniref:TRAP transporter large permease protein n=1 Tax=Enterovirga rhinocerotis TaxID=1339210 RepID=A0A4R7BXW2_9HYPH|nr:TRAP transporter large permease [Enterovirga rhinocerotis]TDR90363.1 C4-dicarboxylate transporter DctM subunit [Enterovirga rhinocerotis]
MEFIALGVIGLFLLALAIGVPVYSAMGLCAALGIYLVEGGVGLPNKMAVTIYGSLDSFVLLAIPLYILAGTLLQETGQSTKLFNFAASLVSRLRGGLGVATILACALFSAVCGSSIATAATIGLVAVPALAANGYPSARAGGLIAAGGTLGILIPPSIALLIYGVLTDQSIGALFVAGVVPGIMLVAIMALYTIASNPKDPHQRHYTVGEVGRAALDALPVLLLPVLIFVGLYTGIATATEVAAIAVVYIVTVGLAMRTLDLRKIWRAGLSAAHSSVMIFMLIAFGALMSYFFTITGVPHRLTAAIAESGLGFFGVVSLMVIFYVVLGTFLEELSMMLITIPILYPVAMQAGIDPLAFGIFVVLAIQVAQISPPVGLVLFAIAKIGSIPFDKLSRAIVPYCVLMILMMYAVCYWQGIATWLPRTMDYSR